MDDAQHSMRLVLGVEQHVPVRVHGKDSLTKTKTKFITEASASMQIIRRHLKAKDSFGESLFRKKSVKPEAR